MLSAEHVNAIVPGGNGVFRPTIVANGRVIGTWKRTIKKRRVEMQAIPFAPFTKRHHQAFAKASHTYAEYLQLEPTVAGQ
jgi:hypothetical protein